MKVFSGIDLGSTTTKAVLLDEAGHVLGRGITNSRSNYHLAAAIARTEALIGAHFTLLDRALPAGEAAQRLGKSLRRNFVKMQHLAQLGALAEIAKATVSPDRYGDRRGELLRRLDGLFADLEAEMRRPALTVVKSEFFRDRVSSSYSRAAERYADRVVSFDDLMGVFDKSILVVENRELDLGFSALIGPALEQTLGDESGPAAEGVRAAVEVVRATPLEIASAIGTGYGRQRLPFPKENIRSEILCHGLGAHATFPGTRTVLDIGGQDTKAIQVDERGIVTSFQMNDRCAAGCGRYLGYIADEMNLGLHELGPLAMQATRHVKINSTCTVFAGAELRERLSTGERKEDILAGLHRAIILRAMALLSRSGGVADEFTFTGGVANNEAAVAALKKLIAENYGARVLNISPESIYTGAYGAAIFARRAEAEGRPS